MQLEKIQIQIQDGLIDENICNIRDKHIKEIQRKFEILETNLNNLMTQILNIKQVCLYFQDKSLYHLVLRIETDETIRKINNAKDHLKSK